MGRPGPRRPLHPRCLWLFCAVIGLFGQADAHGGVLVDSAPAEFRRAVVTVAEENDLIMNTDRHYTQGLKVSYLGRETDANARAPFWLDRFPSVHFTAKTARIGFQLGQHIYTPADITTRELIESDRPYAGWLYAGPVAQRRGSSFGLEAMETIGLELGVIGRYSLGRDAQNYVHHLRGFALAEGWDNQLANEPGLALRLHRVWRWSPLDREGIGLDFLPHLGFSLGNIETAARIGGGVRAGWNLPDDFGVRTVDSLIPMGGGRVPGKTSPGFGVYYYSLWEGRAVGYTAFLDGNLFRSSHRVAKHVLVAEWKNGVAVVFRRFEFGITHVYRTREFARQTERDRFGSIWVKWKF